MQACDFNVFSVGANFFNRAWLLGILVVGCSPLSVSVGAEEWAVPLGGNTFQTEPAPGRGGLQRDNSLVLENSDSVSSVFLHLDRPAVLTLQFDGRGFAPNSNLVVEVGDQVEVLDLPESEFKSLTLPGFSVTQSGYVQIDLSSGESDARVQIRKLVVTSETEGLKLSFVKNNEGNMFYWGRRGPSVHLRYQVPQNLRLRHAYSEITVPTGMDTEGSYFMANGFSEGYFGFQVNSPRERRVLFSVWSPFRTDNPKEIPESQRIIALGRGPEVRIGEFGNEGSGGQSYLVYPWEAGRTYRFLTEVVPDGNGNTVYTSWFGDKAKNEWRLIASFRRPQTNTDLRGFHSFLENFNTSFGYIERRAHYGNVWVHDVEGNWHECTKATFSVDATGGGKHRLDFAGGTESDHFYLRNCGFFNQMTSAGDVFTRQSSAGAPEINFDKLPRD